MKGIHDIIPRRDESPVNAPMISCISAYIYAV